MIPPSFFFFFFFSTSSDKEHAQYLPSSIRAFVESGDLPLRRKRVSVERNDSAERKVWLDTDRQISCCQRCTRGVRGKAPVVLCQFLSIGLRSFLSLFFLSLTSTALSFFRFSLTRLPVAVSRFGNHLGVVLVSLIFFYLKKKVKLV